MLAVAPSRNARTAPADIGSARETLYGTFQIWLWTRGFGTMDEIESELRGGRLNDAFRAWLRSRSLRRTN